MEKGLKTTQKKPAAEIDVYGVHFTYDELFSRLLKLQKQIKSTQIKSLHEKNNSCQLDSKKKICKDKGKVVNRAKRPVSSFNLTFNQRRELSQKKKTADRKESINKKNVIFRTFSPSQATKTFTIVLEKNKVARSNKSKLV